MESFRFRLEKVLELRRKELEAEECRLKRQAGALTDLDRMRAAVESKAAQEEQRIRTSGAVTGEDLAAFAGFRRQVSGRLKALAAQRTECLRLVQERQRAVTEARRRARLLERLRERRWEEWRTARDRELEELAAESYLARWNRERSRTHPEGPVERPIELDKT